MRALRLHAWNEPPVVDEVDEPVRGDGEVLVQVQAAALSHLDLTVATGTFGFTPTLPHVGGVEGSGIVLAADDLAPGTQVLLRGAGLGLVRGGTWQERVAVPRRAVTVLPAPLEPAVAATFFVPTTTAAVVLHEVARIGLDEVVAVVGAAGAVGASVAQQAVAAGCEVVGLVGRPDQLDQVPRGVRAMLVDAPETDGWSTDRPFSLLVDTLGGAGLVGRSRWVRAGGRAVVVGYVAGTTVELDLPSWLLADVALVPVNMIRQERRARELAAGLAEQLAAGTLQVPTEVVTLDDAPDALARMAVGRVRGRAAIAF